MLKAWNKNYKKGWIWCFLIMNCEVKKKLKFHQSSTRQKKIHKIPRDTVTIGFSNRVPRLRPCDVEISSNAFITEGLSSRLSTTRFPGSCVMKNNKLSVLTTFRHSFFQYVWKTSEVTPDSLKISWTSSRLTSTVSKLGGWYPFLNHSFSMTSEIVIRCREEPNLSVNLKLTWNQGNGTYLNIVLSQVKVKTGLTVWGLGSKILLISFFALVENQAGQEKSALRICSHSPPR